MTPRKSVVSLMAALALSASLAGPTLAAAPTFYGPVTCTHLGEPYDVGIHTFTKKDMAAFRRTPVATDFCDKGSVDFSAMEQL